MLLIRWIIILDYYLETFIKSLLFKKRYCLTGRCNKCGKCCETIGILISPLLLKYPFLIKIIIKFYELTNTFKYLGFSTEENALLFSCLSYDYSTQQCKIYKHRPAVCREYPRINFFNKPILIKNCGYKAIINEQLH